MYMKSVVWITAVPGISMTPCHHHHLLWGVSRPCRCDACVTWVLLTFSESLPRDRTLSPPSWIENVLITECSTQPRDNSSHKKRNGTQNPNVLTPLIIPFIMLWETNWRKEEHLWKITCMLLFSPLWLLHAVSGHGPRWEALRSALRVWTDDGGWM